MIKFIGITTAFFLLSIGAGTINLAAAQAVHPLNLGVEYNNQNVPCDLPSTGEPKENYLSISKIAQGDSTQIIRVSSILFFVWMFLYGLVKITRPGND